MSDSAARPVRRLTSVEMSEPAPMPIRMMVRSSENTARSWPSRIVKWRNQRISMPIAANPDRARAMATKVRGNLEFGIWNLEFVGNLEFVWCLPNSEFRIPNCANAIAPPPAMAFNPTATICVAKMPTVGTRTESVTQAPNPAPTVLMP